MFYDNEEHELFKAPVKKFYSYLELVANLKDPDAELTQRGQVRINVQYDRETNESKMLRFMTQANEICSRYI
jgi:hypothetical protein